MSDFDESLEDQNAYINEDRKDCTHKCSDENRTLSGIGLGATDVTFGQIISYISREFVGGCLKVETSLIFIWQWKFLYFFLDFYFVFGDENSLCSSGCPQTHDPPKSLNYWFVGLCHYTQEAEEILRQLIFRV